MTDRGRDIVFAVPSGDYSEEYLEKVVRPVFDNAATWADSQKYGKSKLFEERITKDNIDSPGINIPKEGDPHEEVRCKTWHYYDMPIATGSNKPKPARESNAIRALDLQKYLLEQESEKRAPNKLDEVYSLYWIEHIFGDLHQPLHCVSNFDVGPDGDEGGNGIRLGITRPNGKDKINLHSYWDSGVDHAILADKQFTSGLDTDPAVISAAWIAELEPKIDPLLSSNLEPVAWVEEGWNIAKADVYPGIKQESKPTPEYQARQIEIVKRQVVLGGLRLANYLNRVFDKK